MHIPFCSRKCIYCDFYSLGARLVDWPALVDALLEEARLRLLSLDSPEYLPALDPSTGNASDSPFSTLYIGGGTPSLMPPAQFRRLAAGLLRLAPSPVEFTVEVNPDDVSPELVKVWKDCGVNRVSMGVQSLCDAELSAIGRRHDSASALRAYDLLRASFANVSLDLMFGLPGQTLHSLENTVRGFIDMQPEHISAYSLMYEERTALTRLRDEGRVVEASDEDSEQMFRLLTALLSDAGYEQYEISNYARPGFRSLHNSSYWQGTPYIGIGPSAHSYDGIRTRRSNPAALPAYLRHYHPGSMSHDSHDIRSVTSNPQSQDNRFFYDTEVLTDNELREEMIMTRLRTREGLNLRQFADRFGRCARTRLLSAATPALHAGTLRHTLPSDTLSLTPQGILISDTIISSLF